MNTRRCVRGVAALFVFWLFVDVSHTSAQRIDRRAQIYNSTPTLSPYLNLLRNNSGVLPNYHQFFRPRVQLEENLDRQRSQIERQQRQLNSVDNRINRLRRAGSDLTTGVRANYLEFSHFYPALSRD